ncbi:MAG TPA: sulfatase, partial [Verrucomicrobiae bacterium]|nr:sulfatase [Verrucomicrobiae bacterium]
MGGLSASALLAPAGLAAADAAPPRKKPNFLVVVADDQCFRTLNALNNREVHTPAFDRLLARGTAFTHCFHEGSFLGAVCV